LKKWKFYEEYWKEEDEQAFKNYVEKRKSSNDKDSPVEP